MTYTMTKKRSTYLIEENLLKALKAMAVDKRWNFTTVVEVALEKLLKENEYLDSNGNLTQKALKDKDEKDA